MTAKKSTQKNMLPTDKHIEENRHDLSDFLNKLVSGEISIQSEKETIASKLTLIKDLLEPLREPVINKVITYTILSKALDQKIGLKVSPQTLRSFCQNQLGFPKTERDIKHDKTGNKGEKKTTTIDNNRTYNAEEKLSQNEMTFD